ncbi:MTOR-associated protein MEAK7 [Neocloeon triangulifer]|uniref:MTOR-associated protein MEAK7 n=1 Tax=Neocloeon triangulifer TaxID=2078957 RepID=UPI00286F25D7|nr:MTOR-associated protein MEAK7 [Neocloeon triangulifer]
MGASNPKMSPEEDPLSPEERERLKAVFQQVAGSSNVASRDKLQAFWQSRVTPALLKLIMAYLGSSQITFHRLATLYVHVTRGSTDEQASQIVALASGGGKSATSGQVVAYVDALTASYLEVAAKKWSQLPVGMTKLTAVGFCHDLLFPGKHTKETLVAVPPEDLPITEMEASKWLAAAPVGLFAMQAAVFNWLFFEVDPSLDKGRLMPLCKGLQDPAASILDQASVAFLASALPHDFRKEWRFLFSSAIHGESFSKMLGNTIWQGPTLVLVRDTSGHVFGGFAVAPWNMSPQFVGDNRCFLFNLKPKMAIYPSTGYNEHYQYLNVQQQTMPNGLGMGGQLGYFGLYLDASYGKGFCSESCTTYHSPMMSTTKDFDVSHLEVWAVGPPPPPPEELGERPSVLDLDNEAKAVLAMAGKEQKSDGWREPPEVE